MRSKNSRRISSAESEHLALVKSVPCSVCDWPAPSEAHHIVQGQHFTCCALCVECHTGSHGIHGDKVIWHIEKMDELSALNETLRRVDEYRQTGRVTIRAHHSRQNSARTPSKIVKRPEAA